MTCQRVPGNKGLSQVQEGAHQRKRGKIGDLSSQKLLHGSSCRENRVVYIYIFRLCIIFQLETLMRHCQMFKFFERRSTFTPSYRLFFTGKEKTDSWQSKKFPNHRVSATCMITEAKISNFYPATRELLFWST